MEILDELLLDVQTCDSPILSSVIERFVEKAFGTPVEQMTSFIQHRLFRGVNFIEGDSHVSPF
jgi:hypothetical protein